MNLKQKFSKEFFVIDSNNLNEVCSRLYGYILQYDGSVLTNSSNLNVNLTGMGAYLFVEVIGGNIIISQDYNGSYGLYLYQYEGYFAISNSFVKLVDTIKINHPISLNKDYANAFLFTDVCSIAYEETLVNEIKLLPRNLNVIIDKNNKTINFKRIDYKEHSLNLDSKEAIETLDKWYFKWINIMRYVKNKTNNFVMSLSGGFDTRMILALALSANIDLNKIKIHSIDDDLHTHKDDFRIASEIAKKYNFQLNNNVLNEDMILYENIDIPVNNSFNLKLGFHNQMYFKPRFYKEPIYTFAGTGDIRGFPDDLADEYINKLISRVSNFDELLVDSSVSIINSTFKKLCNEFNIDRNSNLLTQIHYKEVRNRYHFARAQVEAFLSNDIQLNPLLDPDLHKIKLTTPYCDDKLLLTVFILVRYCPDLLNFEFEGGRTINENTLKYAKEINKKYDLIQNNLNFLSGPEIVLNDAKFDKNYINRFDIEKFFKNVFYSKSFELDFKKYFSANAYNSIANQIETLKYHNLSSVYAALSVLKIIKDVEFNAGNLSDYDLSSYRNYLIFNNDSDSKRKMNPSLKSDVIKYAEARIDIKNFGDENNNVEVIMNSDIYSIQDYPNWFSNEYGKGVVIQSIVGKLDLEINCIQDGKLQVWLRGIDFRDAKNNRFPIYIHYTNFKVNGEKIIDNVLVCHDESFIFEKFVKNSEIIKLHIEWRGMNNTAIYKNNLN